MRKRSRIVTALDIGTSKVKVAVAEASAGSELKLLGMGEVPSRGLRKGVVINIEATVGSIADAVRQAEAMASEKINHVYASISGNHLRGFSSNGIVGVRGREVSPYDISKVMEAARAVAIPMDREVLHVLPQEFIVDDQDGIREPLGMSGVRLEARVHIITGAISSAQNVVKCANRCGLTVRDIVAGMIASGSAVLSQEEQELGVCLLDIGGGTTDLAVYNGGTVRHTAVMPVGGSHITNDIAAGLRTPIQAAEQIKCEHGSSVIDPLRTSETIEVPSTGTRPPRVLSKMVLPEIIEPRVTELFELVKQELRSAEVEDQFASGVVITGGTANLESIVELAERIFQVPVRIGVPEVLTGMKNLISHPEYATISGLIMHGARAGVIRPFQHRKNIVSRTVSKVSDWFVEHF
jgi:cell division protein FtsA